MRTLRMTTLDCQRQGLEQEIIESKKKILMIRESAFPDLKLVSQLRESIERNLQLIAMIEEHTAPRATNVRTFGRH